MYDLMGRKEVLGWVKERVNELKKEVSKLKVIYSSYCSKEKLGKGEFDWDNNGGVKYKVGEIYRGSRWDWIREEVERMKLNKEEVFIFSGKYGMIGWNVEIEYYDVYFGKDKLEEGKKVVRDWCSGMVDRYGKFKLVYWVDDSIYKQSRQYVDVMDIVKEYGCELEIREIW
jgi:hypothetical protein